RSLAVVDVAHDGHHRRTRLQIFCLVLDVEHAFFNIGFGDALDGVAEFRRHQLGGIGIDHVAGLHHLALLHEELDQINGALSHTLGEFLNGDRLGQHDFTRDLLTRLVVHRTLELFLATTHRRQRTTTGLVTGQRSREGQLAATALFLTLRLRLGGCNFRLDRATLDSGASRRTRSTSTSWLALLLFLFNDRRLDHRLDDRVTAARFFLGTATRFRLCLQTLLLFRLAARGFFALLLAACIFLGAALCLFSSALALFYLTKLRILQ